MSGGFEDRVRHWMREEGKVDPRVLAIIGDGVAFLPPRRRRSRLPLLVAATLGALAVALLAIPRLGSIDAPGAARPPDPAAFAGDSRLERCPVRSGDAELAFEMPRSADDRLHLPAMGRAPELEVDEPALVVIYQEANGDWGGRRVCVAVGETVNLYTDVDITGFTMAPVDPPPPGCPVLTPRVLPSGAAPGEPSFVEKNRVWGQGTDRIALAAGEAPLGSPAEWLADPAVPRTVVRGLEAAIVAIGD